MNTKSLLKASIITFCIMGLYFILVFNLARGKLDIYQDIKVIISVLVGIYAVKKKMIPNYYIKKYQGKTDEKSKKILKSSPILYATVVFFIMPIGLICFFYDIFSKKGINKKVQQKSKVFILLCIIILPIAILAEVWFNFTDEFAISRTNDNIYNYNDIEIQKGNNTNTFLYKGERITGKVIKKYKDNQIEIYFIDNGKVYRDEYYKNNRLSVVMEFDNKTMKSMKSYYSNENLLYDMIPSATKLYYQDGTLAAKTFQKGASDFIQTNIYDRNKNLIMQMLANGKEVQLFCIKNSKRVEASPKTLNKTIKEFQEIELLQAPDDIMEPDFHCE